MRSDMGSGLGESLWYLLVLALWLLLVRVVVRLRMRSRMVRAMTRARPHQRAEAAAMMRVAIPIFGRIGEAPGSYPTDPYALSWPIVVPPLGDGRPGERFDSPCPAQPASGLGQHGGRVDVQLRLAPGTALNVVCMGRVGSVYEGVLLKPAAERCQDARATQRTQNQPWGDVLAVDTPAGPAWRHAFGTSTRFLVDTHLDHGGWGFIVGVFGPRSDHWLSGVVDAVLATWQWIDDAGRPAPEGEAWPELPANPLAADVTVTVGPPDRPAATFVASARALPAVRDARLDGQRTEAVVRLTSTATLTIESADGIVSAGQRLAGAALPGLGVLRYPAGPVIHADLPAGSVWRRRFAVGAGTIEHQAHLDHAGRGWILTLTHGIQEDALAPVLDRVLATWRWADDAVTSVDSVVVQTPVGDSEGPA